MKTKFAFIVYCQEYTSLPRLECAKSDADALKENLEKLGYKTAVCGDFHQEDITQILDDLDSYLKSPVDEFVFYYSGHGGEINGQSLLYHTDYNNMASDNENFRYSLKVNEIFEKISRIPGNKVIIFDACRTSGSKGINAGAIPIKTYPENSILCFASSPGEPSFEEEESGHGYYTAALLDNMNTPNLPVEMCLKKVAQTVAAKTNKKQIPWFHSSLLNDFCFCEDDYSSFDYSEKAFADASYHVSQNSKIAWVIVDLKSHDYYKQNQAARSFIHMENYEEITKDDLFVLGRNICQAASEGGYAHSFECQNLIERFSAFAAPFEVKIHILNGIAFEMYFDKNGQMRKEFKASRKDAVIALLEQPSYSESKSFIRSKLKELDRIVYRPGDGLITIEIQLSGEDNRLTDICYKGLQLVNDSYVEWTRPVTMKELKKEIAFSLCAPSYALELRINKEVNAETVVNASVIGPLEIQNT